MILHALKEYYDRKAADPDAQMAPPGLEWKEIPYVLTLQPDGSPVTLTPTTEGDGRQRRAKRFLLPQAVLKGSNPSANLLWDTPEYALGVALKNKPERVAQGHANFVQRVCDLGLEGDAGVAAVRAFLKTLEPDPELVLARFGATWTQLKEEGANLTFQLAGDPDPVPCRAAVRGLVTQAASQTRKPDGWCLVTGASAAIERVHPKIKGVRGAVTAGANLVAFAKDNPSFSSFAKEQGDNAPVGHETADAYGKALNCLLGRDSRQKLPVADTTAVFWSERPAKLETDFLDFFGEPPKDDPDRGTRAVAALLQAPLAGVVPADDQDQRFYVLGLAPNAARIAVRFWIMDTVAGMAGKIRQHFDDLRLVHGPRDRDALSLFRLLVSLAAQGKADNIPPNLAGDTMRAILEGLPFPVALLQAAVRRNRAEQAVTYPRASLIKACLNRQSRFTHNAEEELHMSLDHANLNVGYRLGRLFAALEKIQADAQGNPNATIRDRYYGAASGTPATVFGTLMRLKNHHLAKLPDGLRIVRERLLGEILADVADFPAHLPLADQGRFAIGYYHQMQDFYTKKTDKNA